MRIRFDEIQLLPETETLFCEMAGVALAADKPSGRLFLLAGHMGGNALIFSGPPRRDWEDVDEASLYDLARYGLLQTGYGGHGTPNFRLSNDGYRFYQYLQAKRGSPLEQVEATVNAWVKGGLFASRYPRASRALAEAFKIVWTGEQDNKTASDLGALLRGGFQDFADDLVKRLRLESTTSPEKPLSRIQEVIAEIEDGVGPREGALLGALVQLADVTIKQVQRIHHARDEGGIDSWDELRRAAFVLAVLMYELDRATARLV